MPDHPLPPFNAHGDAPGDEHHDPETGSGEQDILHGEPARATSSVAEPAPVVEPSPSAKEFNWQPVLGVLGVLNLVGLLWLAYSMHSMSYHDLHDAPLIYYAKPEEIVSQAMLKKDPNKAQADLIARLKMNHGLVLNENAVVIAAPEFKMYPMQEPDTSKGTE